MLLPEGHVCVLFFILSYFCDNTRLQIKLISLDLRVEQSPG